MPGLKKQRSTSGNAAEHSLLALSESPSAPVRTKPPVFWGFFPARCHIHTSLLDKGNDELLNLGTNPAAFEANRSYLGFC